MKQLEPVSQEKPPPKRKLPSIMDALASVPVAFAATSDDDQGPADMKFSAREKQMKANIKSTLHGAAQYRYTEPAPLEVNVFAGKKRQ